METNEFKVMINGSFDNMVTVNEKVLSRDTEGTALKLEYTVWFRGEQMGDTFTDCGKAFVHAVEIGLDATSK